MSDPLQAELEVPRTKQTTPPTHADSDTNPSTSATNVPKYVNYRSIPAWGTADSEETTSAAGTTPASAPSVPESRSPFKFDPAINEKIAFWRDGDLTTLAIDAILHTQLEEIDEKGESHSKILRSAGPEMKQEYVALGKTKIGEIRVTKGYKLPSRFVFHTLGPKFNPQYRTAAESMLFSSYRVSLEAMRERNLTSLGLTPVHSKKRAYPAELGAHLALRCVRRFLEKHGQGIERIVFITNETDDIQVYSELLPIYFPRSLEEEARVLPLVPKDIGNEHGEPVVADRKIRIESVVINPAGKNGDDNDDDDEDNDLAAKLQATKFVAVEPDHDNQRRQRLSEQAMAADSGNQRVYKSWLRRASTEDLSALAAREIVHACGHDRRGRRIVVLIGRHFPAASTDPEKLMCYLMSSLDTVVNKDYVIVYVHTRTTSENRPELGLLKQFYSIIDNRYKDNLRQVYIVHPTFWSKTAMWFFSTFTASEFKDKIENIDYLFHLFNHMGREQVRIPQFVFDHDAEVNGTDYYQPVLDPLE